LADDCCRANLRNCGAVAGTFYRPFSTFGAFATPGRLGSFGALFAPSTFITLGSFDAFGAFATSGFFSDFGGGALNGKGDDR
jgi:hypothetical protein